jgi:phospholipid-translocating ATPase
MVSALALCHNVTPIWENGVKEPQGSSPDEVTLVKYAEELGIELLERKSNEMIIRNASGEIESYEVLQIFPFSSTTKRMGIVVRHKDTDRIIFYLKGAEDIMKNKVNIKFSHIIEEQCNDLAREGLRTLVITQKLMSSEYYQTWKKAYSEAQISMGNRDENIMRVIEQLENEMGYLGVTGVEDKLQVNVAEVIGKMRESGIAVWMITGDKVETAMCIAISTGLKNQS